MKLGRIGVLCLLLSGRSSEERKRDREALLLRRKALRQFWCVARVGRVYPSHKEETLYTHYTEDETETTPSHRTTSLRFPGRGWRQEERDAREPEA